MAKVFLDTNIYIDVCYRNPKVAYQFRDSQIYFSPLSTHILYYSAKLKAPQAKIEQISSDFGVIPLGKATLKKALHGPTLDLEDNIQLHSAAEADCDYFLTNDKKLLKMKFFGKTRITNKI